MNTKDFHNHTTFSDGKKTPEQTVLEAIEKGLKTVGISDHSFVAFDPDYCMKPEKIGEYIGEIQRLKEKYADKIEILCGIEQDIFSGVPEGDFDYVIGSVHYIKAGEEYIPVDATAAHLKQGADKYFGGDIYALIEEYYRLVGTLPEKTGADIVGHFDLITKFQEKEKLFDEQNERYTRAWQAAADKLLSAGLRFEINSGAISRGYRTTPYPAKEIKEYILQNGGKFVRGSDSHRANTVANFIDL